MPAKVKSRAANEEVGVILLIETDHRVVINVGVAGLEKTVDPQQKRAVRGRQPEPLIVERPERDFLVVSGFVGIHDGR